MAYEYTFTVFTPTYNRAHLLPRAYDSLRKQSFRDFEWLIVDDGSTDGTETLVKQWQQEAEFPIRYYRQENKGMNSAINRGVELAEGKMFVKLDSDDWLATNTLERMLFYWESIPDEERPRFVGVAGLCASPNGEIIGTRFPQDVLEADSVTIRTKYRVQGDKFAANRIEVLREYFPYPEHLGRYIPEALMWNRIAQKYKTRYVNEVFAYVDYQPGGVGDMHNPIRALRTRVESAHGMRLQQREFAELPSTMVPLRDRIKAYANFVRYSLHAGVGFSHQIAEARRKWLYFCSFPVGVLLYLNDQRKLKRNR
jgi:hypothetical protein